MTSRRFIRTPEGFVKAVVLSPLLESVHLREQSDNHGKLEPSLQQDDC